MLGKWKVSVVMSLLIVLLLGACNDNDLEDYENELLENDQNELNEDVSNPVLEEEDVELILRHMYVPEHNYQGLRDMVDNIEGKTGVKVTLDEGTEDGYEAMLSSEATRNELPHIIQMYTPSTFLYENTEHLLDLTDFLEESGLIEQLHSLDSFTVDGRVYGLPEYGSINQLFYKKDLVEELGGVPETWNDLVELMEEAKRAGYTPILLDDFFSSPFILFEGILQQTVSTEKLLDLLNGDAKWTDDEFVAAFELMETLKELDISLIDLTEDSLELPEGSFTIDYEVFFTDDIVFTYTDTVIFTSGLLSANDDFSHMQGNIGVMSIPSFPGAQGEQSSVHGKFPSGYVFRANVTEEEEQMIYQFIETLLSEELMFEHHVQYGGLPSIRVEPDVTNDELFQEIIHKINEADGVFLGLKDFIPYATKYSYNPYFYESEISNEINRFISGKQSIQEMVEAMQSYHEEVLQEANLIE